MIACLATFSCEKVSLAPESYSDYFELVGGDIPGAYVDVVPNDPVSKKRVKSDVVGHGWESVAIYELDKNKTVVAEYEIVRGGDFSSSDNKEYVSMFEITGFGQDCLKDYDCSSDVYELLGFNYDEATGRIDLRCWHVGHNGKLVYLSDDVMVCVDSKEYVQAPQIYMVVFKRASDVTLQEWRDQHPYKLTWE